MKSVQHDRRKNPCLRFDVGHVLEEVEPRLCTAIRRP